MCDCEEFEDYEYLMSTNFQAEPAAEAPVQEEEPVLQIITVKRKK
jgi:hypothetical protein